MTYKNEFITNKCIIISFPLWLNQVRVYLDNWGQKSKLSLFTILEHFLDLQRELALYSLKIIMKNQICKRRRLQFSEFWSALMSSSISLEHYQIKVPPLSDYHLIRKLAGKHIFLKLCKMNRSWEHGFFKCYEAPLSSKYLSNLTPINELFLIFDSSSFFSKHKVLL